MLIKAYIKQKMYKLPMSHDDLAEQIAKDFNLKVLNKKSFAKMYGVTSIEDIFEENIKVADKFDCSSPKISIFILNLLLKIFNHADTQLTEVISCDNADMIEKINEITGLKVREEIELLEQDIFNYLSTPVVEETPKAETPVVEETPKADEAASKGKTLEKVEFSMAWIKKAHREL